MTQNNPLQRKMRTAKLYTSLPSDGKFYSQDVAQMSPDNTLPIMPMTAMDEMTLKTPDALLNGDGIVKAIESCCPNVHDARQLFTNDVDVIMMAIRSATYGDKMDFRENCPQCGHENEFQADISYVLDTIDKMDSEYPIQLDKDFYVYVLPYTLDTNTKVALESFEQQKILNQVSSEEEVQDLERIKKFGQTFYKLAALKNEILLDSIDKVIINDDGWQEVTQRDYIEEWLKQTDTKTVEAIQSKVSEINEIGIRDDFDVQCQDEQCGHTWKTKIYFDPSDFFGTGS